MKKFLILVFSFNLFASQRHTLHYKVKRLMQSGQKINLNKHYVSLTPLISAAIFGDNETIDYFLKNGADIDFQNSWGRTALGKALNYGQFNTALFLLKKGAKRYILDNKGNAQNCSIKNHTLFGNKKNISVELLKELYGECPICLENFSKMEYVYPCGHAVHKKCNINKCPFKCIN